MGVRPGKLVDQLLDYGFSEKEVIHRLGLERGVQKERAGLLVQVAMLQRQLLAPLAGRPDLVALYIGVPFCPSRCTYCSFVSHSLSQYRQTEREAYFEGLLRELEFVGGEMSAHSLKLAAVYIGGGTPTTLSAEQLAILFSMVEKLPQWEGRVEVTLEAGRPDTIDRDKLLATPIEVRLSINPQSMNNDTLRRIGRSHSVEDVLASYELARTMGFSNINMDLIVGLPDETPVDVSVSVEQVLALQPESITLHMFSPKRASKYGAGETWEIMSDDEALGASAIATEKLSREMRPYYLYRQRGILGGLENTGWARPGRECLYNILVIGETHTVLGVGAGASSIFPLKQEEWDRHANPKDAKMYLDRLSQILAEKQTLLSKWRSKV